MSYTANFTTNRIELDKYRSVINLNPDGGCSICYKAFEETQHVATFLKGHISHFFHEECFERSWNIKKNCPSCRAPLQKNQIETAILASKDQDSHSVKVQIINVPEKSNQIAFSHTITHIGGFLTACVSILPLLSLIKKIFLIGPPALAAFSSMFLAAVALGGAYLGGSYLLNWIIVILD